MSKFLRVKCACGNEQNVFGNAAKEIKCLVCGAVIANSTGSRVNVAQGAKVIRVL